MQMKKLKTKLKTKQFTLIELIIVIVVIGILAGIALPKFIGVERNAKVSAMDQDLDALEKAVDLYVSDNDGNYPFTGGKVSVTAQTLKDTLDTIGDDGSQVYTLDMDKLKPYLQNLKYSGEQYEYSTISNTAINPIGKIDSSGITHHILDGGITNNTSTISTKLSIKKQFDNFVLFSNGEVVDIATGEIVQTNVKDFYHEEDVGSTFITNTNKILFGGIYSLSEISGYNGIAKNIYSDGVCTTLINTNEEIFYSYEGDDFKQVMGFSGVIDKFYTSRGFKTIINTDGEIFFNYGINSFTKVSGFDGIIDKVYSDGKYTIITNTNGEIFYSYKGHDFKQVIGFSGVIDKYYSDGYYTTIINTNGDVFYSGYGGDFEQRTGPTANINNIDTSKPYVTVHEDICNTYISQDDFMSFGPMIGLTGTVQDCYIFRGDTYIITTGGNVFYSNDNTNFTQISGFTGTIKDFYTFEGYVYIITTDGNIFCRNNDTNFTQISGFTGNLDKIYSNQTSSDKINTFLVNNNGDIYYSSDNINFVKLDPSTFTQYEPNNFEQ